MNSFSNQIIGSKILLQNLIESYESNNLPNSIIFYGPKGIGKSTMSFNLIKEIFKKKITDNLFKHHLNLLENNTHPNIKYISKIEDEKTNKIKSFITIDQIRNLESFLNQSSLSNLPKFVIIDASDDLNINSSNSLLKSIEEPKFNNFFILITHQLSSIIPTIRSRCVKYNIPVPNYNEFSQIIKSYNNNFTDNEISFFYHLSNSSPGLALNIANEHFNFLYKNILEIFSQKNTKSLEIINLSNILAKFSNDDFKIFLILLRFILITSTKINLGLNYLENLSEKFSTELHKLALKLNNSIAFEILEYLNDNERDLFIYNLDKKLFCLNIFTPLRNKYE